MNTTELFKFRFVDREHERDIISNFFDNKKETTLWIKGASGFGKTTFFNYMFENCSQYALCYIDIKPDNTSMDIITNFILQLQKYAPEDFVIQFKNQYKKLYNNISKDVKEITKFAFPQISSIISILFDASYTIITNNDENRNCIDVILNYIREILNNKKLCICIDNFSRCDLKTASLFFQIFKTFLSEDYFRSCIITTTEELKDELKESIYRNLPYTEIVISELKEYAYFGEILNPIFDQSNIEDEDLQYIYQKCNGSPQKLSTIISKLLDKSGITISRAGKAIIDKKVLYSILQNQRIYFDDRDFNQVQQWILFSYLCLSEEVEIGKLEECALFLARNFYLFNAYDSEEFKQELTTLVLNKVLKYSPNNIISAYHDSGYRDLLDIFESSPLNSMFHHYAYEFLIAQYPAEKKLICRHARESSIPGWENLNFRYGKCLAKKKQYYDAQKVFIHLNRYLPTLNVMQGLFIAINSYETGNYQLAIEQLRLLQPEILRFYKAKYYYYFYLGKSYNNIGKVNQAVKILESALSQTQDGSKEYINILYILQMYYLEIPQKRDTAIKIFNKIKDNYKEQYPQIWANTIRGCHNFMNPAEALPLLGEAEKLLENELEEAFLKTTIGFVHVRMNQLASAQRQFEEACKIIERLKIHESSYALNDLAICYMLNSEYQNAKDILLKALLWNRTDYGKLAIYCHLLACTINLNRIDESMDYYEYLDNYIMNYSSDDPIIKRKIYLNLAIANKKMHRKIQANAFLEKAKDYVINSSSEWRYYNLKGAQGVFHKAMPLLKYEKVLDFEPWFIVYAHD